MIIPNQVQIETVAGLCSVSCNMCPIETHPRQEIMTNDSFLKILTNLLPHVNKFDYLTLSGIGEPLLDKGAYQKVKIAKELGFSGVAVYTNGTPLTKANSKKLLAAKLDTLVVSLDGISRETQDVIRRGGDVDKIIKNIIQFIDLRNSGEYLTKLIIRFTRQELNAHELPDFKNFWLTKLNSKIGDQILTYDVHNHGNLVDVSKIKRNSNQSIYKNIKCDELYRRLTIHSNGQVGLCCGDHNEKYKNGSALDISPVDIYNSGNFTEFREKMANGAIMELDICRTCSVIDSLLSKEKHVI